MNFKIYMIFFLLLVCISGWGLEYITFEGGIIILGDTGLHTIPLKILHSLGVSLPIFLGKGVVYLLTRLQVFYTSYYYDGERRC